MATNRVVGYYNGSNITEQSVLDQTSGYTHVVFSFWLDPSSGALDSAGTVQQNPGILDAVKNAGKKAILAAGGATYYPDVQDTGAAETFGAELAQYALEMGYDGVDFDIENIQMNADSIKWLATATNSFFGVEGADALEVSHAPQAPYFSTATSGYAAVEAQTKGKIDFYNIQYYNQGDWAYQSYEDFSAIFDKSYEGTDNPTAILSIPDQGVPAEKLVVGKPITAADATNTGYIPTDDLAAIIEKAKGQDIEFGGVMGWKIDSDTDGKWGDAMDKAVNS